MPLVSPFLAESSNCPLHLMSSASSFQADKHFAIALDEARKSGLPMFELLAARDWKKHALAPAGRPTDAAEAAIDSACAKMNKTRGRFTSLLV